MARREESRDESITFFIHILSRFEPEAERRGLLCFVFTAFPHKMTEEEQSNAVYYPW